MALHAQLRHRIPREKLRAGRLQRIVDTNRTAAGPRCFARHRDRRGAGVPTWCRQLAADSKTPQLAEHMAPNLAVPYDSRWPAILQPEPLDLTPNGKADIFRRSFYTAAVWQVVRLRLKEDRAKHEVYYARSLYKIGCGIGLTERDLLFSSEEQNLTFRPQDKRSIGSLH